MKLLFKTLVIITLSGCLGKNGILDIPPGAGVQNPQNPTTEEVLLEISEVGNKTGYNTAQEDGVFYDQANLRISCTPGRTVEYSRLVINCYQNLVLSTQQRPVQKYEMTPLFGYYCEGAPSPAEVSSFQCPEDGELNPYTDGTWTTLDNLSCAQPTASETYCFERLTLNDGSREESEQLYSVSVSERLE